MTKLCIESNPVTRLACSILILNNSILAETLMAWKYYVSKTYFLTMTDVQIDNIQMFKE